jgi:hypothetical protein
MGSSGDTMDETWIDEIVKNKNVETITDITKIPIR